MRRLWVEEILVVKGEVKLDVSNVQHIKALRLRVGDLLIINNGDGYDYTAELIRIDRREAIASILQQEKNKHENRIKSYLFQGMIKSDMMDLSIQKAVELGVYEIIPIISKRVVVLEKNMPHKLNRWKKIMIEACKQSERAFLPTIYEPITLEEAVTRAQDFSKSFVADEGGKDTLETGFYNLAGSLRGVDSIGFFVGPEGGWDPSEREHFKRHEITAISLGKRILRAETAGMYLLSIGNFLEMITENKK